MVKFKKQLYLPSMLALTFAMGLNVSAAQMDVKLNYDTDKIDITLETEDETYDIYGGKADEIADVMELLGMGFGIIAKLIDKIRSAFKDAQRKPANQ